MTYLYMRIDGNYMIFYVQEITGPTHIKRAHSLTTWTGSGKIFSTDTKIKIINFIPVFLPGYSDPQG